MTGTFARAEQLIALQRYREAIAFCKQQLAESPRCVTLRLLLARALLADGSGAAGVAQLEECLRIDPATTAARKLLGELGVDLPMPVVQRQPERDRSASIAPLPPPPSLPPARRVTAAPIAPSPRVVYSSPPPGSPSPSLGSPLPSVRVAHDPPARARRRLPPQRRKAFANPFVAGEAKPTRSPSRWERPLSIEARRPQPLFRLGLVAMALAGLMALWRLGREDAASLPTAALAAASQPTPEPALKKADSAPLDGLAADVWVHPLAGPERRMPVRDSRLFGAERDGDRPSECRGGHCGIDLAGGYGEPVFAVHDGRVERVQRGPNPDHGGRYVRLIHRDGSIATQYFHLSEIPRGIREGLSVKAGEVIGFVGLSGVKRSEPHLHFTIEVQDPDAHLGRYLDPEPLVALWPLRVAPKGDEPLRLTTTAAPPGLARGFIRRRHRHRAVSAD